MFQTKLFYLVKVENEKETDELVELIKRLLKEGKLEVQISFQGKELK